jgi:2-haloacid dehalogenase
MKPRIKAIVFEPHGTLFDLQTVTALCEEMFPAKGAALSKLCRAKQLEYTWLSSVHNQKSS